MILRRLVAALFVVAALCATRALADEPSYNYLQPGQVNLVLFLPPPPDPGSAQERADQADVAAAVAARSNREVVQAEQAVRNVFFFAPSVGPAFDAAHDPVTAAFFERVGADVHKLVDEAKLYYGRPRPSGAAKKRGSYPSGHAAFAAAAAVVLSQLVPCKRDEIFKQARAFGENRIILGLHYPSDIVAGWTSGTLAAFAMMESSSFQRDLAAAKTELRGACPA
ncbi:MAG TPA: phosphatase PAP2 family protein [Candidatus Cybelea sp.]|jgi:acid phosphatase (class A)|nr:phosphatase PAP2 family protein [Candidatus Cybelea sp.]